MNWRLTFGDQRRGGHGPRHYLEFALFSGCVMFGVFALLIEAKVAIVSLRGWLLRSSRW